MTHGCATGPKYLLQFFKYRYTGVRSSRARYFFPRETIALNCENYYSRANRNYTINLTVLCLQDGEIYFGVRWLIDKWGKLSAFYIKAECLLHQSRMPWDHYRLATS
ncbi:hypothetical protein QUA70_03265 [Microcoleus sp. LAD1_D5]